VDNSSSSNSTPTYTYLNDVIANYKTDNTKIGIDVSSWQGDINFQAVKDAGVEFVFIRVGSTRGIGGEYFVDKKFTQNIKGFNEVGIPVGIYFYTYANSKESAINDAKWVLEQIEGYKIDLPIAYDWESWSFYNEFHQSFYSTTMNAKAFLDTIYDAGYDGLLYSSKRYLEQVWYDTGYETWLAHYTNQTSYEGTYRYWQMCSNGRVNGINGNVDINIMYTD
ncbi:MAG: glycoside hydrolase family 25, partial [Bacilli bacterium]|nr:glycoside hydrolase family 25 [Bacilli bacterium]